MLSVNDIKGMYAIMATPAKPGAERIDATDTVDLDELARITEQLIQDGCDGLVTLGTTAECATLTPEEWQQAAACVLETVNRRVPTFIGTTALGSHEIAARNRFVQQQGADGIILGLPMWQACTQDMALQFYQDMSQAFPGLAIMCYANPMAFRFNFGIPFWAQLTQRAPTVICAKHGPDPMIRALNMATQGKIRYLPHCAGGYSMARLDPDNNQAFWATEAGMGPQPVLALRDAIAAGDWDRAAGIDAEIAYAMQTFFPPGGMQEFGSYNIQLEKIRIDEAGYSRAGPIRPPYHVMPQALAEGARECGRRWKQLAAKYAGEYQRLAA